MSAGVCEFCTKIIWREVSVHPSSSHVDNESEVELCRSAWYPSLQIETDRQERRVDSPSSRKMRIIIPTVQLTWSGAYGSTRFLYFRSEERKSGLVRLCGFKNSKETLRGVGHEKEAHWTCSKAIAGRAVFWSTPVLLDNPDSNNCYGSKG